MSAEEIDRYLEELEEPKRNALEELRRTILRLIPQAEEGLSYGVPAFKTDGKVVAGFSAAKDHLSYLPHSGSALSSLRPSDLEGFIASKGALQFTVDNPLPDKLVAQLVAARQNELED